MTRFVALVVCLSVCGCQPAANMNTGVLCSEISGQDVDGKPIKLSDYRGKVVLVSFWGTWCPPCRDQLPHEVEKVNITYKNRPFVILGIAADSPTELKSFLAKRPLPWPNIVDGDGEIAKQWNIGGFPAYMLIDQNGYVVRSWLDGGAPPRLWSEVDRAVAAAN